MARGRVWGADSSWRGGFEVAEPEQTACGRNAAFARPFRTFYSAASTLPRFAALTRLGFLTGDSLRAIDGYDLATPETALEAYAHLRNAPDYHVEISRFGRPKMPLFRVC